MNILSIETAFEACSVALSIKGDSRERFALAPRGHAEQVLPWVEELLAEAGCGLVQVDAIAFSRGPGSFTSLRIGIGIVQGLAWGADLPVIPLSSLQITAQAASAADIDRVLVAMDARMGEVFCGGFLRDDNRLMQTCEPERVCPPEQAASLVRPEATGVGNGFVRYPELVAAGARLPALIPEAWPKASSMLPLALNWLRSNAPLPAEQAQPVYLRDKVAQKQALD